MKSFKRFLEEQKDVVYFTFGRMNPPTAGHEKLLDTLREHAGRKPYCVFLSKSHDSKKNPLIYESKLKYARKFFPRHARAIRNEDSARCILTTAAALYKEGYKSIVCVVGDDRVHEFREKLEKYNGVKNKHGLYVFESIEVRSAGQRDPDSSSVEGVSASNLRESAEYGDFVKFSHGLPKSVSNSDARSLFKDIRRGLGLRETVKNTVTLEPVSEIREKYIRGDLFETGDSVVIKENNEVAKIKVLGSNYVIVETSDNKRYRKWLDDVEKVE